MNIEDIFGYIGAGCLIIRLMPQIYLTWKSKSGNGLSYLFLFIELTACINFLIYSILIWSYPILIANAVAGMCSILLIFLKTYYSRNPNITPKESNDDD
jgi:MtN3 and saliva related transmembrane protein